MSLMIENCSNRHTMDGIEIETKGDSFPIASPIEGAESKHETSAWMTKYEYTRLLAARALQISTGDSPKIDVSGIHDPYEIARREIHARVVPLVIQRVLPNGKIETWNVRDMHIRDN